MPKRLDKSRWVNTVYQFLFLLYLAVDKPKRLRYNDFSMEAARMTTTVETYIKPIRNQNKKAYASAFWAWIQAGEQGTEPSHGNELHGSASRSHELVLLPQPRHTAWLNVEHGLVAGVRIAR